MNTNSSARPFLGFLQQQRNGVLHDELTQKLSQLVAAVQDTDKGGELTLKITVKPASAGEGTVTVADKVTLKLPELERHATLYYTTPDHNLQRQDPNQRDLDLAVVPTQARSAAPPQVATPPVAVVQRAN